MAFHEKSIPHTVGFQILISSRWILKFEFIGQLVRQLLQLINTQAIIMVHAFHDVLHKIFFLSKRENLMTQQIKINLKKLLSLRKTVEEQKNDIPCLMEFSY